MASSGGPTSAIIAPHWLITSKSCTSILCAIKTSASPWSSLMKDRRLHRILTRMYFHLGRCDRFRSAEPPSGQKLMTRTKTTELLLLCLPAFHLDPSLCTMMFPLPGDLIMLPESPCLTLTHMMLMEDYLPAFISCCATSSSLQLHMY